MRTYWILLLGFILLISGCSRGEDHSEMLTGDELDEQQEIVQVDPIEEQERAKALTSEEEVAPTEGKNAKPAPDKVIYHAQMEMITKDFADSRKQVEALTVASGGYMVNSSVEEIESRITGTMVLRIPQAKFKEVVNKLEDVGEITSQEVNGNDISEEYVDLTSRLSAKEAQEKRLLTLMEQAEDTKAVLQVSEQLGRVQEEIEQLKGRKRFFDNQVALSTITIHLVENSSPQPKNPTSNLSEDVAGAWVSSLNNIGAFVRGLTVFFVGALPILFFILVVAAPFYWWWRRNRFALGIVKKLDRLDGEETKGEDEQSKRENKEDPLESGHKEE
ncbi:DUF4349 domain-containing protein [Mechercharimyces sp. CAU 1602]|uniref:DUF4349 domain-containing protein n=1 Tax=Mechercharimyces sp. CAU 1602 TaxID=2973933 RepID=UPI0021639B64|nr:DUF4349 domain-containing protein [Mechercharimyces sp. CAU 1602]MCS1351870.1 DUF4349 domain-containing protein [Mechercharimyces sp. CAU 1602]